MKRPVKLGVVKLYAEQVTVPTIRGSRMGKEKEGVAARKVARDVRRRELCMVRERKVSLCLLSGW